MKLHLLSAFLLLLSLAAYAQQPARLPLTKAIKDSLKKEILDRGVEDQKYRWHLMFGELDPQKLAELRSQPADSQNRRMSNVMKGRVGISQAQKDSLWVYQGAIDSANFIRLSGIIKMYGFPKKYIDEWKVTTVLLHNTTLMSDDFFELLKEEVLAGNLSAKEYAGMHDRVRSDRHLPQLYCVSEQWDSVTKTVKIATPVDIEATNKARKEIGLKKWKG
jgi:hypothetical protein